MPTLVNLLSPRPSLSGPETRHKRTSSKFKKSWSFFRTSSAPASPARATDAATNDDAVVSRPLISRSLSTRPRPAELDRIPQAMAWDSPPHSMLPRAESAPVIARRRDRPLPLPPHHRAHGNNTGDDWADRDSMRVAVGSIKSRHSTIIPTTFWPSSPVADVPELPVSAKLLETGHIDSTSQPFLDFMRADRALGEAVNAIDKLTPDPAHTRQPQSLAPPPPPTLASAHTRSASVLPLRRRYTSMLTRSRSTRLRSPSMVPAGTHRRAWVNAIFQPSPHLPQSRDLPAEESQWPQQREESAVDEVQRMVALRQAVESVHAAQDEVLTALSAWSGVSIVSERMLNLAQAVSCRKLAEQLDEVLHLKDGSLALEVLRGAASRLCDTLEDLREGCRNLMASREADRAQAYIPRPLSPDLRNNSRPRVRRISDWGSTSASPQRSSFDVTFPTLEDFPSMRSPVSTGGLPETAPSRTASSDRVVLATLAAFEEARIEFVSTL